MPDLYYDPVTWEIVADPNEYWVLPYNPTSFQVVRRKNGDAYIVDIADRAGAGSCTCGQYLTMIDEISLTETCKHIRLVKCLLRPRPVVTAPPRRPRSESVRPGDEFLLVDGRLHVNGRPFVLLRPADPAILLEEGELVTVRGPRRIVWRRSDISGYFEASGVSPPVT